MDALTSLLDGPRARGAFLLRAVLAPPWAVRVRDEAPLTLLAPTRGTAWIDAGERGPVRLAVGDVAVVRGPEPYVVADDPATEPGADVLPGGCSVAPDGTDLCDALDAGVRTWGLGAGEGRTDATSLLIGSYQLPREVGSRLLRALPRVLVLRDGELDAPLLPLLGAEVGRDLPGQDLVLDRLLDLLLVSVLRAWFARSGAAKGWYRAHGDPVVGPVLRLLHEHPAHPWTVPALAARAGVSRAALARRFAALVGEPPMAYLTARRLDLAAELLGEPDLTVDAVARRVGYGSGFALSTAFKRERGVSPAAYRAERAGGRRREAARSPGAQAGRR
ncbi:AraC family transcriptional regulator [Streptomyces marincola]|uniref:AraC family transcriptional regulator n=1 Tax=Streptomyces marincola TaxID=2878388 RepID=UPI001CF4ED3F|nr:AraC family transcriptional regulator [Streptomyces marincola]UCM87765.1 AraC family transcriptional regulator [Streptomyces marincola]